MSGDHHHDAPVTHQSSEGQSLTPQAEKMQNQVQEIAAGRGAAGSSTPSSFENNNAPSGNKAVDNLPKVDFYDSKAGGSPPPAGDNQANPGAAGSASSGGSIDGGAPPPSGMSSGSPGGEGSAGSGSGSGSGGLDSGPPPGSYETHGTGSASLNAGSENAPVAPVR